MRNPDWYRDELILALELYLQSPANPPGKTSKKVVGLSQLLNRLGHALGVRASENFRNPNGVYMKMMNFRRFDPEYVRSGKVGLTRGNRLDEIVWNEFSGRPEHLRATALAIRKAVERTPDTVLPEPSEEEGEFFEASEGKILTRIHRTRERNRTIVNKVKARALKAEGTLRCQACNFDFAERYGVHGEGFIEAHHISPIHTLTDDAKTTLSDFALLCANCHRIIHRSRPWLTVEQLQAIIAPRKAVAAG